MYPQVIREHRFDAALFGTSTVRLIDPARVDALMGVRSANLAMNSATAWEQTQIAELFLRETPQAKLIVVGLDPLWCAPDADQPEQRLTFRAFPESFYDANAWNDWPHLYSLHSIEIAWRVALNRLGLMPERLRRDGFEVFTPPEDTYDLARARGHIYATTRADPPDDPTVRFAFPALSWLEGLARRAPAGASKVFLFPPAHVANQFAPGSLPARREAACKAEVAAVARRTGAVVLDFRLPSDITRRDENYWDTIHYRLPIADRIARAIADALRTGLDSPEGDYRVLAGPLKASP
jgi:hypothetical protein